MRTSAVFRSARSALSLCLAGAGALTLSLSSAAVSAAILQLASVGAKSTAEIVVDGISRELKTGAFIDEGLLLQRVDGDHAEVLFNGQLLRLRVGDTVIVDTQTQGYPTFQLRMDPSGKYATNATINNVGIKVEIDRNSDAIVIWAEDAKRLKLNYQDAPSRSHKTVQPKAPKPVKGKDAPPPSPKLPDTYKTYSVELANVRVGAIDLYGLRATVSENPNLKISVLGRDYLKRAAPSWNNGVLTLVRR